MRYKIQSYAATITTSSPALISTWGSIIKRESRLSGVPTFLRPDKLELRSIDVDKDPVLDPLETEGDRDDGEETFATDFLSEELLPVLSRDVEGTLFIDDTDVGDGLVELLFEESCLLASEDDEVLVALATGDTGTEFLTSEMPDLVAVLVLAGGNELLRISGRDLLTGSKAEEPDLLPATVLTLESCPFVSEVGCFSCNPPVLFLLITGIEPELREALLTVDFVKVDLVPVKLQDKPLLTSAFFFTIPVEALPFGIIEPFGFTPFGTFLTLSEESAFVNSDSCDFSTKSLAESVSCFP